MYRARRSRNKYGAKAVKALGHHFDSTGEFRRFQALQLKEAAGAIRGLTHHPKVTLLPGLTWELDYVYEELHAGTWRLVYEDFKGVMTAETRLKAAVWGSFGPTLLRFTKGRGSLFETSREVVPNPAAAIAFLASCMGSSQSDTLLTSAA